MFDMEPFLQCSSGMFPWNEALWEKFISHINVHLLYYSEIFLFLRKNNSILKRLSSQINI